jgi:3-deoxy-7-phosphoheptulonate synthase
MSVNSKPVWKILTPEEIVTSYPLNLVWQKCVMDSKIEIWRILSWESDKKLLIIWPCSADFKESLLEYADFIKDQREIYKDKLEIVMRHYTGKPRTVWVEWEWKWLLKSNPWEKPDVSRWLVNARSTAINLLEMWVPLADEMLHPELIKYFEDIYSYLAIWARSTENQSHREITSGLDIPVWFKNPTSWDIITMINSILAWQSPNSYVIWDKIYDSEWNLFTHGILRWWKINWKNFSNYSMDDLELVIKLLKEKWVQNPWFIVDTNHENSNKQYEKQIDVMSATFQSLRSLKEKWVDTSLFKWFMTESYLFDGRQNWPIDNDESKIQKWLSLTDPCIWIEKTRVYIDKLATEIDR